MEIWIMIASVLSGLIVCVPLVIKLVQVTREAVRKGNWNKLVAMAANVMAKAEVKFADGATRKKWALEMIRAGALRLGYVLTDEELGKIDDMIDQLCAMAKIVNAANTKED